MNIEEMIENYLISRGDFINGFILSYLKNNSVFKINKDKKYLDNFSREDFDFNIDKFFENLIHINMFIKNKELDICCEFQNKDIEFKNNSATNHFINLFLDYFSFLIKPSENIKIYICFDSNFKDCEKFNINIWKDAEEILDEDLKKDFNFYGIQTYLINKELAKKEYKEETKKRVLL